MERIKSWLTRITEMQAANARRWTDIEQKLLPRYRQLLAKTPVDLVRLTAVADEHAVIAKAGRAADAELARLAELHQSAEMTLAAMEGRVYTDEERVRKDELAQAALEWDKARAHALADLHTAGLNVNNTVQTGQCGLLLSKTDIRPGVWAMADADFTLRGVSIRTPVFVLMQSAIPPPVPRNFDDPAVQHTAREFYVYGAFGREDGQVGIHVITDYGLLALPAPQR